MDTFIRSYTLPDVSVCDTIIEFFENNTKLQQPGYVNKGEVDRNIKASTDISLPMSKELWEKPEFKWLTEYHSGLQNCLEKYKKEYDGIPDKLGTWGIVENFSIQRYKPNEGYYEYHTERTSLQVADRMMVFMTYLNDVQEGGETEWYFQKLKVQPRKGLTVFWPTDWNFLHRGKPAPKETKYIITGWYNFYIDNYPSMKSEYEWNVYG